MSAFRRGLPLETELALLRKRGSDDFPPMQTVHICGVKGTEETSGFFHCRLWGWGVGTQPHFLG